jgi:group II intron reverse transcriptase/maturase
MRSAETILGLIHDRGRRGLPLERFYRLLYNRDLYLLAYGRLARNQGAMTPGATLETVDGMTLAKIDTIIDAVRHERYRWTPVRRVYVSKKRSQKRRPIGIPAWSDKLLQEVLRLILEAYYEPQFSNRSHGFRPGRGCHTALDAIYHTWIGTKWFVEGDVAQCFDRLDHTVLVTTLAEKIHDGRFLRLAATLLQAGYVENWRYHATLSGSPQGSGLSPLLANLYLDRLDRYVETVLLPAYNRGERRRPNPLYTRLRRQMHRREKQGEQDRARELRRQMQQLPSLDPADPAYRRLHYLRYADDWLLGFAGPRQEAEEIKQQLAAFLRDELKLDLSQEKTLITHARTGAAHFLGYEIVVLGNDQKRDRRGYRSINGQIGLKVPQEVVQRKCARYLRHGKATDRPELLHDSVYSIVVQYQQEYRGLVAYYRLAYNLHQLNRLRWLMEWSLTQTLAEKLKTSVRQVYRRYQTMLPTGHGPRAGLQVTVQRGAGQKPLIANWGGITLARQPKAVLNDQPTHIWASHTELEQRLLADTCELCGSHDDIQVHHIRALKDLQRKGRVAKPFWVQVMAARQRKTLVTCRRCHADIHAGRPIACCAVESTGEPVTPKGVRPVRRGADGKVPTISR